jgi:hypothetical protein
MPGACDTCITYTQDRSDQSHPPLLSRMTVYVPLLLPKPRRKRPGERVIQVSK